MALSCDWVFDTDAHGRVPLNVISRVLEIVVNHYSSQKFTWCAQFDTILKYCVKWLTFNYNSSQNTWKIYTFDNNNKRPAGWCMEAEREWYQVANDIGDTEFWDSIWSHIGPETSWEDNIWRWRCDLPSFILGFLNRSWENLPDDIRSDFERQEEGKHNDTDPYILDQDAKHQ